MDLATELEMADFSHRGLRAELESHPKETEKLLENAGDDKEIRTQLEKKSRVCADTTVSSADDSTEGSLDGKSGAHGTSILAGHKRETKKCPSFLPRGFYSWSSQDGKTERVTPFAVVLLLVLLAVYVLNQADRLVLPVVIPNGLRCDEGKEDCGSYNASGVGGNGSSAHSNGTSSSRNCIQFDDDQQGLLTGAYCRLLYTRAKNITK